ncbi:murein L,D-transpeptidase catalytic domain-containing protein [Chromobacterium sp. IIBBL 290-4]|uniref:murein L,D-transpeptidase catalytic domain-containing protein n=1 Tax=Chromobacterium sp. IIBBL 290-4 TaxID=2953890 RepID=UPI0020B701E8|nr:murein L,D-transpeptidase catalytic domain family protein [Chromobacterium sp. IIBBL 290-4]UTH74669.1 murein L,D-transpeptidase catalytic domain family protein [Chromobacterium sp. IIBBL 290-4]
MDQDVEEVLLSLAEQAGLPAFSVRDMVAVQRALHPRASLLYWAVVDFSLPSSEERLFVFDTLECGVQRFLVAHGAGRERNANLAMASDFSNDPASNASCLGVCRAAEMFDGPEGVSLRLDGLQPGNANMRARNLVMHGAAFASRTFLNDNGILGRSDGSLAVDPQFARGLINMLHGGSYLHCIAKRA